MNARASRLAAQLLALFAALAVAWAASAAQPAARPGYEYRPITQQPLANPQRIEVIEFFWYGCPYCNQLQAPLAEWLRNKPDDVEFRRIPAIFRESWVPHARLYYALEALGELPRLHYAVFNAYHGNKLNLDTADSTAEWAMANGLDRAKWLAVYNSPDVERKVEAARKLTQTYQIQGTPSVVVDGRYVTSSGMSETVPGVVTIVDDLVRLAREQRRSAGK